MKKLLIIGCILLFAGLLYLKTVPRNSDSIPGRISNLVFNNNRIELNCVGVDKSDVDVIWSAEGVKKKWIIKSGIQVDQIGNEYGPNGLEVIVENNKIFKLGNWKTANWHTHDYTVFLFKSLDGYEIKFIADGPDFERTEQEFDLNGKPNGFYRTYYANGNLSVSSTYKEGLEEGQCKYYHKNGKIRGTSDYFHGKMHGYYTSYSPDGKIEYKKKYSMGIEMENVDTTKSIEQNY